MGSHALRDAVGVRVVLLRGWDVEFSEDLVDPDVRRCPPAADVVPYQRFPGVLNVVTALTSNDRIGSLALIRDGGLREAMT